MIDDDSVLCASCDGGLEKADAFEDDQHRFFHPCCAEVWRCPNCGWWNDKESAECEADCGEKRP
jgi:hypothetical protein